MPEETKAQDPQLKYVVDEFKRYEASLRDRFDEAQVIYDRWNNVPPTREYDWQNQINVPLTLEAEQTITPRLFTALFPTEAPVDVHVEGDAPEEQGIRIKGMTQHQFRVSNVQGECWPMLTQATLFGTGYVEGGSWYIKKGWVYNEATMLREYSVIESRPDCKFVDFFELFPHPEKVYVEDPLPVIRRRFIDAESLKALLEDPRFDSKLLEEALNSEIDASTVASKDGYVPKKREQYELMEYWGPWDETYTDDKGDVKTRKAVPYWIMVINRKVKIRAIPNPYNHQQPPYCKVKLFEDPKRGWFGVGIGKIGKPCQDRANKIVNQRLDNVDLILNKQGCYNGNDTLISTKKLQVSRPGQWHKVSDVMMSLKWIDTPDVTSSSYKEEELAKQDFREATGATAYLMPEVGEQHRTAMGIQLLQGAAGVRFRPVLRQMEIDLIQKLAMFYFSNLKQFMTMPEWVLVTGKNGEQTPIQITPQQLQAKVFFIPTGISETLSKEIQVGQLLRFKEITMQDPTVNRSEVNKRIAELMGFKDIQKLLTPIRPPMGPVGMDDNTKMAIQRRLGEGASKEDIIREFVGPPPTQQPQMQGAPQ